MTETLVNETADAEANGTVDQEDLVAEAEPMTLAEAGEILSQNPMYAGLFGLVAPLIPQLEEIKTTLKKITVTDSQVKEYLEGTEDKELAKERDSLAKAEQMIKDRKAALHEKVKKSLKGDDVSPEKEKDLRDNFKTMKDQVGSFVDAFLKVVFQGNEPEVPDDNDEAAIVRYNEFVALKTLQNTTPTLQGVTVGFKRHMSGDDNTKHVRTWLATNYPNVRVSDRGRIAADALKLHADNCSDCKARVSAQSK